MTTAQIEILDLAKEMGFENWLGDDQTKGWYTCLLTGKKFRGEVAKKMIEEQEEAMKERQSEIGNQEADEEIKSEEEQVQGSLFSDLAEMEIDPEAADQDGPQAAQGKLPEARIGKSKIRVISKEGDNTPDTSVVVMGTETEDGGDTLGVLHVNGMIDKITEKLAVHLEIKMVEGKPVKMTTIHCADCGTERQIKVQDKFQVTRCPDCQKKHRNRKRAERRRQLRAEAKSDNE